MSNPHQNEIETQENEYYSESEEINPTEGSNTIRIIHDQLPNQDTQDLHMSIDSPISNNQDLKSTQKDNFPQEEEYELEIQNQLESKELAQYIEAVKESMEEMYQDKLLELHEEHETEKNTLMELVETLKSENERLNQDLKRSQSKEINEEKNENFLKEELEEYYMDMYKKLEEDLIEKFKHDTESYMHKLDSEMQEILITKGITKDRMKEIEEEVRSQMEKQYETSRNSSSVNNLDLNQVDVQNSMEFKVAVRTEIQKKERLIEINFKKRLRNESDKIKAKLELEFQEKEKRLREEIDDEKLEFSRRKSTFNIRSKKLVETRKRLENDMKNKEKKYQKMIGQLKKKLERAIKEKEEVVEKSERIYESSTNNFNRKISEEGQNFDIEVKEEEELEEKLPNFGGKIQETELDDYSRLNSALEHRRKNIDLPGDRHTFGISEGTKPLYPITESKVQKAEDTFGMENSDIFQNLIREKPKLLSHEEPGKKNIFNIEEKNQENIEDQEPLPISERSPFHSEFRKANMVNLEDTQSYNFFSQNFKNSQKIEEKNPESKGVLQLKEGTMKNLADELIERYLSNSGNRGAMGVNISEHLDTRAKLGSKENLVEKIDLNVITDEESLNKLTRNLLSKRKRPKAQSMMKFNQNNDPDLSRMIEENSNKMKQKYNYKSNQSQNFSQNDSILNRNFKVDPQIYKHRHSKTYHGQAAAKNELESYVNISNAKKDTEITISKKKSEQGTGGSYLDQILKHAEIEHGLTQGKEEENKVSYKSLSSRKSKFSSNTIFDKIFKIRKNDSTKVKAMKVLRNEIEQFRLEDNILLPKVIGKISYLSSDFIRRLSGYTHKDPGKGQYISELFILLEKIWKEIFMSYEGKLEFLSTLEKCNELGDFASRLKLEIDYLNDYKLKNSKLLSLLKKREMLKAQIITIANGFKELGEVGEMNRALSSCSTILRRTLKDIIKQVDLIRRQKRDMVTYKGVPSDTLLRLDYWELEYLKKCEGRYSRKIGYLNNF